MAEAVNETLKPCAICGGAVRFFRPLRDPYYIQCCADEHSCFATLSSWSVADLIKRWNGDELAARSLMLEAAGAYPADGISVIHGCQLQLYPGCGGLGVRVAEHAGRRNGRVEVLLIKGEGLADFQRHWLSGAWSTRMYTARLQNGAFSCAPIQGGYGLQLSLLAGHRGDEVAPYSVTIAGDAVRSFVSFVGTFEAMPGMAEQSGSNMAFGL